MVCPALVDARLAGLRPARELERHEDAGVYWQPVAQRGRWIEVDGSARLTWAAALLAACQQQGEPAAWICGDGAVPAVEDLAAWGIDAAALPVIVLPDAAAAGRAADMLLQSAAFGLVVVDLPDGARWSAARTTRLAGLVRRHEAILLTLRPGDHVLPGSNGQVDARLHAGAEPVDGGRFDCRLRAAKDRRHGPGWSITMTCRGPAGVC